MSMTRFPRLPAPTSMADIFTDLNRRQSNLEADCFDDETRAAIGPDAVKRSQAKYALLSDLIEWLEPAVAAEVKDRQQAAADDSAENQWRDAGYDTMGPVEQWNADANR